MGVWNGTKRAAKFVAVTMPMSMFGINQLRMGQAQINDLYRSLTNPICPECNRGTLKLQRASEEQGGSHRDEHPWVCTRCGQVYLAPADKKQVKQLVAEERNKRAAAEMASMDEAERRALWRSHAIRSRWYFGSGLCLFGGFLYMLASGASLLLSANWLALGFVLFVYGLKASYRAWQVATGTLFQRGAFPLWLWNCKWFI